MPALQRLPVAVTGWIQQIGPMAVLVLGLALGRRHPPSSVWLACGVAVVGLYLVSGAYRFELLRQDGVGIALALASAACFATYFVVGEQLAVLPTRTILTWGYLVAALVGSSSISSDSGFRCFRQPVRSVSTW